MFLNCGCCGGDLPPFTLGIFHQHLVSNSDPLATNSTATASRVSSLGLRMMVYYRVTDSSFTTHQPLAYSGAYFGRGANERLDAILVGSLPAPRRWDTSTALSSNPGPILIDPADWYSKAYWLPATDSDEYTAIEAHLAAGGDLILSVPPVSWFAPLTGHNANYSEADTAAAAINTWLESIGSATKVYGLYDSAVIDKIPVLPDPAQQALAWSHSNAWRACSCEIPHLNTMASAAGYTSETIPTDFHRAQITQIFDQGIGEARQTWRPAVYFRNADSSTHLETIPMRQVRFATQQSVPAGAIEVSQLGLYAYMNNTGATNLRQSQYLLYGNGATTAAVAIREPLPGGGTLYVFRDRYQPSNPGWLMHWANLVNCQLPSAARQVRYMINAYTSATSDVGEATNTAADNLRLRWIWNSNRLNSASASSDVRGDVSGLSLYRSAIASRVHFAGPTDLKIGSNFASDDPSNVVPFVRGQWYDGFSVTKIVFRTPDQGASPYATLLGPHWFIWGATSGLSSAQHLTALPDRDASAATFYRPQTKFSHASVASLIGAGFVTDDGPYADYFLDACFLQPMANDLTSTSTVGRSQMLGNVTLIDPVIVRSVLQMLASPARLKNTATNVTVDAWPVPGIYAQGKIWSVLNTKELQDWAYDVYETSSAVETISPTQYRYSREYPLTQFVNINDVTEVLDWSTVDAFVLLSCIRLDSLEWGVNLAAGTQYELTSVPRPTSTTPVGGTVPRYDFGWRYTDGVFLDGLEITITAELDTTFTVGQTITYSLTITNSSENTLDVTVAATAIGYTGSFPDMAPAAVEIDTHVYTITEADVTAGLKLAVAIATAEVPTGTYQAEDSVTVVAA